MVREDPLNRLSVRQEIHSKDFLWLSMSMYHDFSPVTKINFIENPIIQHLSVCLGRAGVGSIKNVSDKCLAPLGDDRHKLDALGALTGWQNRIQPVSVIKVVHNMKLTPENDDDADSLNEKIDYHNCSKCDFAL